MNEKHKKCDENKHDQSNMYFLSNFAFHSTVKPPPG